MRELAKLRTYCWRNSITLTLLLILSVVIIAIHYSINLWSLDKGYISSDEGWYMYLFDHQPIDTGSHGHILFGQFTVLQNIYYNRLVIYVLKIVADGCFCYGFYKYLRAKSLNASFIIVWGFYLLTGLYVASCSTINYTQLINIIAPLALGFVFFGLTYNRPWLFALSGFILAFYFPVKITSMVVVPFALLFIWLMSDWRNMLWCILGGLIGIAFEVFVIESPTQIYEWITSVYNSLYANTNSSHSGGSIAIWTYTTCRYCFKWGLIALLFISIRHYLFGSEWFKRHKCIRSIVFIGCLFVVFGYSWNSMYPLTRPTGINTWLKNFVWISAMMTGAYWLKFGMPKKLAYIVVLMIAVTIGICFGTDVDFIINHSARLVSVLMALSFLLPGAIGKGFRIAGVAFMLFALYSFLHRPLQNWHGDIYAEQTVPVKSLGIDQPIYIDQNYADRIMFVKGNVPANSDVLVSIDYWGPIELLGLNALEPSMFRGDGQFDRIKNAIERNAEKDTYIIFDNIQEEDPNGWPAMVERLSGLYDIDIIKNGSTAIARVNKGSK